MNISDPRGDLSPDLLRATKTVVTHADCPDGIASALILHHVLPDAGVVFVEHNTPEHSDLPASEGMLFCDIAPPAARVQEFVEQGAIVLDHHRAARPVVEAFGDRGVFADEQADPGVSGATLAYREVWRRLTSEDSPAVRRLALRAGVRDCWQRKHPEWSEATAQAAALVFFGYDALVSDGALSQGSASGALSQGSASGAPEITETVQEVGRRLVRQRHDVARVTAESKCFALREDVWIYNDRDRLLSDVAQLVFDGHERVNLVAGFHYKVTSDGEMLLVYALRSRQDTIDVSTIAKANGGGGHRSAAGFSVPAETGNPLQVLRDILTTASV